MKTNKNIFLALVLVLSNASTYANDDGNRYNLTRLYQSEISSARAFLNTRRWYSDAVIIDVRRVEEYIEGHPPRAYSIPFPHITGSPDEASDSTGYIGYDISTDIDIGFGNEVYGTLPITEFTDYVERLFPNKDKPIYTICRSGYRSVQAANALTKAGYTNVRNIWEGFLGTYKTSVSGRQLDLNNDGVVDSFDTDGWSVFQDLPVSNNIFPHKTYLPYIYLYY